MSDFLFHDDVIKWKHFPHYWPFVRGIHRSPVNSTHKGQWRGAWMFSLICALNKRLSKQWWGWWLEMPSPSLWCHCNDSGAGSSADTVTTMFRAGIYIYIYIYGTDIEGLILGWFCSVWSIPFKVTSVQPKRISLTHWPLHDVKLLSGEYHRTPLMLSQQWFR